MSDEQICGGYECFDSKKTWDKDEERLLETYRKDIKARAKMEAIVRESISKESLQNPKIKKIIQNKIEEPKKTP